MSDQTKKAEHFYASLSSPAGRALEKFRNEHFLLLVLGLLVFIILIHQKIAQTFPSPGAHPLLLALALLFPCPCSMSDGALFTGWCGLRNLFSP